MTYLLSAIKYVISLIFHSLDNIVPIWFENLKEYDSYIQSS